MSVMPDDSNPAPRSVPQVMVSSTFTDLKEHRNALIQAISKHDMHPVGMEFSDAKLAGDVVDASLGMVAKSAAYILIIGRKYGQTPECPRRNPEKLSVTELEYREAVRLKRPVLLFLMGDKHPRIESEIELDPDKRIKLAAFRELAKKSVPDTVNRVYGSFESLEELKEIIGAPLSEMQRHLEPKQPYQLAPSSVAPPAIPTPPAFYAEPDYIGSHQFVGRQAELDALSDWANRSDPTNLLLFEAIGGNGKSMLTWDWSTKYSPQVRPDWAGRFWYSFYERGAIMQDFCQRALAYMTGRPLKEFETSKTAELKDELITQLHARPWLLILDGLERILVAYHRIDAAEVPDEEANTPTDKILTRNPCDAIRDEDSDLLRALAACTPSKILVSSRLTPRILLNPAGQTIPGAKRITLPGLRPQDAETLLRQCGITGDSAAIQDYLQQNCDNHPLVIGILGGLIANYLPDRGNFDAWSVDPSGGAALDLAKLDLIQRRNHILRAAISSLSEASRQLLSTLALLAESVDYKTLEALNPHLPAPIEEQKKPMPPEMNPRWDKLSDEGKAKSKMRFEKKMTRWQQYQQSLDAYYESVEFRGAPKHLWETIHELERRGLLQYDRLEKRYDLHPVVRGVALGLTRVNDRQEFGQKVVDLFSSLPHAPFEKARTIHDLKPGLSLIKALLKLGRYRQAFSFYQGELARALKLNLEAHVETLSLLRPFFPVGWGHLPNMVKGWEATYLINNAGNSLAECGEFELALSAYSTAMMSDLDREDWKGLNIRLRNSSRSLNGLNRLARAICIDELALELALVRDHRGHEFMSRLNIFADELRIGRNSAAKPMWDALVEMGRNWVHPSFRRGKAEYCFAEWQFQQGTLMKSHLEAIAPFASTDSNRRYLRRTHRLYASWYLSQSDYPQALASFHDAVRMARERRLVDAASETGLALAKHNLGLLTGEEARSEAQRLAQLRQPAHRYLAMLWLAIGDRAKAEYHALAAYRWAWADGEPYVHRYELTQTTELLNELGLPIPKLPPYDAANDEPFRWEADVRAAIEKLKAEKEAKTKK
jgi:hypothetical protein